VEAIPDADVACGK